MGGKDRGGVRLAAGGATFPIRNYRRAYPRDRLIAPHVADAGEAAPGAADEDVPPVLLGWGVLNRPPNRVPWGDLVKVLDCL